MFSAPADSAHRQSSNTVTRPLAQPTRSATFFRRPSLAVHGALLCLRGPPLHEAGNPRNRGTGTLPQAQQVLQGAARRGTTAASSTVVPLPRVAFWCGFSRSPNAFTCGPRIPWPPVCKGHGAAAAAAPAIHRPRTPLQTSAHAARCHSSHPGALRRSSLLILVHLVHRGMAVQT